MRVLASQLAPGLTTGDTVVFLGDHIVRGRTPEAASTASSSCERAARRRS
jgi:hypothetical protein